MLQKVIKVDKNLTVVSSKSLHYFKYKIVSIKELWRDVPETALVLCINLFFLIFQILSKTF